MKQFLVLSLVVLIARFEAWGQDVTTVFNGGVAVNEGYVCEILNMAGTVSINNTNYTSSAYLSYAGTTPYSGYGVFPVAGPCIIQAGTSSSLKGVMTYRIRPNVSSSTSIPANAVVIPTDATGDIDIILESSTDLVNWTQANPGTYGASATKRFFRVRAVNK